MARKEFRLEKYANAEAWQKHGDDLLRRGWKDEWLEVQDDGVVVVVFSKPADAQSDIDARTLVKELIDEGFDFRVDHETGTTRFRVGSEDAIELRWVKKPEVKS